MPSTNQEQIDLEQAEAERRISERRQDREREVVDTLLGHAKKSTSPNPTKHDRRSLLMMGLAIILLGVVIGYLM
jgi:6-phosphofructokinase